MEHIIKTVPTCSPALLEGFAGQASATVHEAMGRRGAMSYTIKPVAKGMRVCGRALTVECHSGDNLMLLKALSMAKKGDVIVADMGKANDTGPFGEMLATECMTKQVAGLVISSSVRDSREIAEMGFPVFSSGISIRGTTKSGLGSINHCISCGGVVVYPGDIIVGDDDGVVVVPLAEAEQVLEASRRRTASEAETIRRLKAGESMFEIKGYQKVLDALHCTEESV